MSEYYIMKEDGTTSAVDFMVWAKWYETANRKINKTKIAGTTVSTVFRGLDLKFGDGPPLIFETLVFGGPLDQEMDRYSTIEEARAGHAAMVERVKEAQAKAAEPTYTAEQVKQLTEALRKARDTFRHYTNMHRNEMTVVGLEKALRNEKLADEIDQALKQFGEG